MKNKLVKFINLYYHGVKENRKNLDKQYVKTLKKFRKHIFKISEKDYINYLNHFYNVTNYLLMDEFESDSHDDDNMKALICVLLDVGKLSERAYKELYNPEYNPSDMNSQTESYSNNFGGEEKNKSFVFVSNSGTEIHSENSFSTPIFSVSIPCVPKIKSKKSNTIKWVCNEPMTFTIEKNGQLWFNSECWDYLFRCLYTEAYFSTPIIDIEQTAKECDKLVKSIKLNIGFIDNKDDIIICFDKGATNVKSIEFERKFDSFGKPFGVSNIEKSGNLLFYLDDIDCKTYQLRQSDIPGCLYGTPMNMDKPNENNIVKIK